MQERSTDSKLSLLPVIVFFIFAAYFLVYRWGVRMEPLGSDDLTLFQYATEFFEGTHWLFSPIGAPSDFFPNHQSLRLSTFLFSSPLIALFGATSFVFYLMPLIFAFSGFATIWIVVSRTYGLFFAILVALMHIYLPFEIVHSSFFLVDLPAAVLLFICPLLVVLFSDKLDGAGNKAFLYASIVGVLGFLSYLFRSNGLFFLGVTLFPLFLYRRYRKLVLWTMLWVSLFVFLEQLLYFVLNLGFGFRWRIVSRALENYSKFLPTYDSPSQFLLRCFRAIPSRFGDNVEGYALLGFYSLGLTLHPLAIAFARAPLVKSIATLGFVVWVVFALGIYEWNGPQIRAMAPPKHRYFQPFYYSTLVLFGWLSSFLFNGFSRCLPSFKNKKPLLHLVMVVQVVLICIHMRRVVNSNFKSILTSATSEVRAAIESIDGLSVALGSEELKVFSTVAGSRVLMLFRNEQTRPRVLWQNTTIEELIRTAAFERDVLALDVWRLSMDVRYQSTVQAEKSEKQLKELYNLLDAYQVATPSFNRRFLVYAPRSRGSSDSIVKAIF